MYSMEELSKVYGTIYNIMIVRKSLWEYLILEIYQSWIPIEDVLQRSWLQKYIFQKMLLWSSMWTVKKNRNLEGYLKIAQSIPITIEQFNFLLKKSIIKDNSIFNRSHIPVESVYVWFFHPPKEDYEGHYLRKKIHW